MLLWQWTILILARSIFLMDLISSLCDCVTGIRDNVLSSLYVSSFKIFYFVNAVAFVRITSLVLRA